MKWMMFTSMAAAALLAAGASDLAAQENATAEKYSNRYTKDTFDQADTNQDGFISWDEARSIGSEAEKSRFGRDRFDAADADGDGRLSAAEAGTLIGKEVSQKGETGAAGKERVDAGGKNPGSKAESARTTVSGKYANRYTKEEFGAADSDGDGFISREEAKNVSAPAERELFGGDRFDKADANGDGRLSSEEVRTMRQKEMSSKELGTAKAKQRKGYKGSGSEGSGETAADAQGRKRTGKQKRYRDASAKSQNGNPRMVRKQSNAKKRHRARRPVNAGD